MAQPECREIRNGGACSWQGSDELETCGKEASTVDSFCFTRRTYVHQDPVRSEKDTVESQKISSA